MRPALLLAAALAACGPADAPPAVGPAPSEAAVPEAAAPASAFSLRTDSLTEADAALRYEARIAYPQVEGEGPLPEAVAAVNAAVVDSVRAFAAVFRPEAPPPGVSVTPTPVGVEGGFEGALLTGDLLSALVSVYAYTGGAHGNTFFLPLTFDLTTGAPVRLGDLFRAGTSVGDTLAAWVERGVAGQIAGHLGEPVAEVRRTLYTEGLDDVREGRFAWTLGPDAFRVHVPPYQLAAYAAGSFDVDVPYAALRPFAVAGGPLDRLGE